MRFESIELQTKNELIKQYRDEQADILKFFDYKPFASYEERLAELSTRTFERMELVTALKKMNLAWDAPDATLAQIEQLKADNSVVVIGGQQAGLLTGPLYTINKIISIIKLAKEQSNQLKVPVIPVFWIAGEDHDFDEVNHVYTMRDHGLHKHINRDEQLYKKSLSDIKMDKEKTKKWLTEVFQDLQETEHTRVLFDSVIRCFNNSETYVDFFARLIFEWFKDEGIVLIDSANKMVRKLEKGMFKEVITKQAEISNAVYKTVQTLQQQGYTVPLDVDAHNCHFFYHDENGERILLFREGENWIGKNEAVKLTTEQLLNIAENYPEKLSNNVVTRPLFQELLFPTLAFVAGDGEISYWASLKQIFHLFHVKVPPVVPRLSFTYVTKRVEKLLEKRVLKPNYVVNNRLASLRTNWLMSQQQPPIEIILAEARKGIEQLYEPLHEMAKNISVNVTDITRKNETYVLNHLAFLEKKMIEMLEEKYKIEMDQFTEIENMLFPLGVLQERIWNPLYFLNAYGTAFIGKLAETECTFENDHYLVYLQ